MTSSPLRDLRCLRIAVLHPEDADCRVLVKQLMRIGCRFEVIWPPAEAFPAWADVIFVKAEGALLEPLRRQASEGEAPAIIALVDFEDPTTLEAMLKLQPNAVMGKPLQPQGVLANLVVARHSRVALANLRKENEKLQRKLNSMKLLTQAKAILMEHLRIDEPSAHEMLRKEAMRERVAIEQVAQGLVMSGKLLQPSVQGPSSTPSAKRLDKTRERTEDRSIFNGEDT